MAQENPSHEHIREFVRVTAKQALEAIATDINRKHEPERTATVVPMMPTWGLRKGLGQVALTVFDATTQSPKRRQGLRVFIFMVSAVLIGDAPHLLCEAGPMLMGGALEEMHRVDLAIPGVAVASDATPDQVRAYVRGLYQDASDRYRSRQHLRRS